MNIVELSNAQPGIFLLVCALVPVALLLVGGFIGFTVSVFGRR